MTTNTFSSEELNILSQRNQELFVLDALTEQNKTNIKQRIQLSLDSLKQSTHHEFSQILQEIKLMDYQVGKGPTLIPTIQDDFFMVHFELSEKQGKHWFLIPLADATQWLNQDGSKTKEAIEVELEDLIKATMLAFRQTFFTHPTSDETLTKPSTQWTTLPNQTDDSLQSGSLNWNQFIELKTYQFELTTVSSSNLTLYHISDLTFTEHIYDQLTRSSETIKEEIKMSEKQQSVVNANVGIDEISSPVFSELTEETVTNNPLSVNILDNVPLEVSVVLGKTFMTVDEILNLSIGRVIPIDKYTTDSLEIYFQCELVALGDPVTIEEKYGTKITKNGKLD